MTPDSTARRIVVGYDGSPASRAALARGAERVGADGELYVVRAYSLPELIHLADCTITVIPERVVDREASRETAGVAS